MPLTSRQRLAAVAGSFAVYLIPLVGPHAFWVVGVALALDVRSDRDAAWIAADLGLALLAQIAVWLVLRWSLGGSPWRRLSWVGAVPLMVGLNFAYLVSIPSFFLIEADTLAEQSSSPEHCCRCLTVRRVPPAYRVRLSGPAAEWIS
jgi:hypothetical protein